MMKLFATLSAAAGIFASAAAFAMPFNAHPVVRTDTAIETARLACDQFGRCWRTGPEYSYQSYGSSRSYRYGGYGRAPTKWEQKGFCPPGQRKKGNC